MINQNNPTNHPAVNVLDLFCGCGGMTTGLVNAGLRVIAGVDIWDKATESYNSNHSHKAYCADLTQFTPEQFNARYIADNPDITQQTTDPNNPAVKIDLLVCSPPCQSFSMAGRRDVADPRNDLFMEVVKYLQYFKPKAFMIENVIGILSKQMENGDKVIDVIMEYLTAEYNCRIHKLFASDFGVPQNRRRTIIVGFRKDLLHFPVETIPQPITCITNRVAVRNVLLPRDQIDASYYLSERAIQGIKNKKQKSKERGAGFGAGILNMDKPSFTIPARYWKDGYDALVQYSETELRRLTILELKRIQSFPDEYVLCGSKKDAIMQIGNAVPCLMAYHLGLYLKTTLELLENTAG